MSKDKKPCSSCSKNVESKTSKTSISKGSTQDDITNFKKGAQTVESPLAQKYTSSNDKYRTTHIVKTLPIKDNKNIITKIIMLNILYKFNKTTKTYKNFATFQTTENSTSSEREIFQKFPSNSTPFVNIPKQMTIIRQLISKNNNSKSKSQLKSASGCCQNGICSTNNVTTQQYDTINSDGVNTTHYKCTCNDGWWDLNGKQNVCWTKQDGYSCNTTNCDNYNPPSLTYVGTSNISIS